MIDESLHKKPIIEKHVLENKADEFTMVGQIRKRKGLTLYSYNRSKNELKPAKITTKVVVMVNEDGDVIPVNKNELVGEKVCDYFYSLNEKNAQIKVMKSLGL